MPLILERTAFRSAMRAAAVSLLQSYAIDTGLALQIYPARPLTINPPTAFVDSIRERVELVGPARRRRRPVVNIVVVHGVFDSKDAAEAGDAFVDGFLEYVLNNPHQAEANTLFGDTITTQDDPNYVPDWLPPERHRQYYATIMAVEGLSLD